MIKLKLLLKEMEDEEEETEGPLKSINDIKQLVPQFIIVAQKIYDSWDQSDPENDELNGGGICHLIADEIAGVLQQNGIDAVTVSAQIGEQHVYTVCNVREGVFEVDISPSAYESGGGYTWRKTHDVIFDTNDIIINMLSPLPRDFKDYIDY